MDRRLQISHLRGGNSGEQFSAIALYHDLKELGLVIAIERLSERSARLYYICLTFSYSDCGSKR